MKAIMRTLIVLVFFILQENLLKLNRRKMNLLGTDKGLASIDHSIKGVLCI
jgi:hypothetical protein